MEIEILIADDHRIFREGLRALLESEADMSVIGEAEHKKHCPAHQVRNSRGAYFCGDVSGISI